MDMVVLNHGYTINFTDMTITRNGLENGLVNGLEGTSLKMLFLP